MFPYLAQLRTLPRPFWILIGATFVNRFGLFVWPFLTIFITRNGNTATEAGLAVAAYSTGSFGAAILGGWLADRLGRNITLALASFGSAVCMMTLSQASDWRVLSVIAFATGLIGESGQPAGSALIQDLVPTDKRVLAFAVHRFAVNLGWSVGPAVAGLLAESSFFWLFVVDAATSAFFGMIAWTSLPRGRRTEAHKAGWRPALVSIRQNPSFLALAAACLCVAWVFRQTSTSFPLHFERSGLPMTWCGLVLAMNGLMICLLEIPLASFTRVWPVKTMLGLGYVLMGGAFLFFQVGGSLLIFIVMMIVFTLGEMCSFSRQQAYAASLAPEDMRGRYAGFLSFAWSAGGIVTSVLSMQLYEINPGWLWFITAGLGITAALLISRSGRSEQT
ncbi:Dipeptide/tripeptide permease [Prosthecobacter debontii]|uniref:Dipeptide/tripeptide permease n=1 Tax=Prosthecobacter debontii TaxID=48467 RepID=A0A1T4XTG0_9BACT|nr:MFS transporter [Prosthecobacter debontii]SKA92804.1 Dipeptide/tripeptide permease [Prosthecobacter debontii]